MNALTEQNHQVNPDDYAELCNGMENCQKEFNFLRTQAIWANSRNNAELAIQLFSAAANFATMFHPGIFVDSKIENDLLRIGQLVKESAFEDDLPAIRLSPKKRSLLHVFSEINTVGGHCRTLINWIRHDSDTQHVIVVLRQTDPKAIDWLQGQLARHSASIHTLDHNTGMLNRAIQLRKISRMGFFGCVNHVGQAEAIPTIAFAVTDCPPVLLIDHADHSFWLGIAVTDIVVHQRPIGGTVCDARRKARSCFVLPIPLDSVRESDSRQIQEQKAQNLRRVEARHQLGIGSDQIMALTVGRGDKYRPINQQNYFRSANQFLSKNPRVILHVVGVERHQAAAWSGTENLHKNFVFHGETPVEPHLREAADLYLESYPFGSQTAFLEAALEGVAGIRAPVDTALLATSDSSIDGWLPVPKDEHGYWEMASHWIEDSAERNEAATRMQREVRRIHMGSEWKDILFELYQRIESTEHTPQALTQVEIGPPDRHDIALHRWQRWSGGSWADDRMLRLNTKSLINIVMSRQLLNSNRRMLPSLAFRALLGGRADVSILKKALLALSTSLMFQQTKRTGGGEPC